MSMWIGSLPKRLQLTILPHCDFEVLLENKMESKEIDITGQRFGRLTAIKKVKSLKQGKQLRSVWLFKCSCGKEKEINKSSVTRGKVISCGCHNKERMSSVSFKHGKTNSRLYSCWRDMKNRCYLPSREKYKNYGARGITVCEEWKNDFVAFYDWAMANGYRDDLTLDRIDVNGKYSPDNCKWSTQKEQQNNRTNNHIITIKGITKSLSWWLDFTKTKENTYYFRKSKGLSDEDALLCRFNTHGKLISKMELPND